MSFHNGSKQTSSAYTSSIYVAEHLKRGVDKLVQFISFHVVVTPYSYLLRKYNNAVCCRPSIFPIDDSIQDLVMQRQPTPCANPLREGHFLQQCDALKEVADDPKLLDSLLDLTSHHVSAKNVNKKQDTKVGKAVKGWDATRIRASIQYFCRRKLHFIYTATNEGYKGATAALQQT